jgi:hypothetical protein
MPLALLDMPPDHFKLGFAFHRRIVQAEAPPAQLRSCRRPSRRPTGEGAGEGGISTGFERPV